MADEENEYDSIIQIMAGMKFYDILTFSWDFSTTTVCTYRTREQVSATFDNKFNVIMITNPDDILEAFGESKGIYCIELHNNYKSLKSLAEDLAITRLSGMMNKELGEQ